MLRLKISTTWEKATFREKKAQDTMNNKLVPIFSYEEEEETKKRNVICGNIKRTSSH